MRWFAPCDSPIEARPELVAIGDIHTVFQKHGSRNERVRDISVNRYAAFAPNRDSQ